MAFGAFMELAFMLAKAMARSCGLKLLFFNLYSSSSDVGLWQVKATPAFLRSCWRMALVEAKISLGSGMALG